MMDFVTVAIRIKPCQNLNGKSVELVSTDPPIIVVPDRQQSFSYDYIFPEDTTQENVYGDLVQPLVKNVINGYNSTIFAYGQTGTGKTFTIGSDPTYCRNNDAGLITRALNDIMSYGNYRITTHVSFVEIYNEKVYDLLGDNKTALQIKNINGAKKEPVKSQSDGQRFLTEGGKNRHTGETKQNLKSSRSHAIFTIHCNVKSFGQETQAKLNLVDLAGSESVKKTGNEGSQLHEGININKGLLHIGQVINALANNRAYVPYRESTITAVLKDSFNKRNYVSLVACIGTNIEDLTETVQTLEFAQRAKRVRNKPEVNSIIGEYAKCNIQPRTTPYKLSASTPHKFTPRTPMLPKSYNTLIKRPLSKCNSTTNISAAEFTMPSTSMSVLVQERGSLSPIIKKCMDAVEQRYLTHMTNIVKDFMTPMAKQTNSPRISRQSLQREITNTVRRELSLAGEFQTFRNEIDRNRDTSASCVDDDNALEKENQAPSGDIVTSAEGASFIVSGNMTPGFKRPFTPMKKIRRGKKSIAASSPINETPSPKITRRRSVRISQRLSKALVLQTDISCCEVPSPKFQPRRSTRISTMKQLSPNPVKTRKRITKPRDKANELRLTDKNHTTSVLKTLNSGKEKDIMKLNTIGAKYTAMICQFRQMKGNFRKISDLEGMPWRGNGYKKFIEANFLVPGTP